MPSPQETLLLGFEIHSAEKIEEALAAGIDVNGLLDGKTPLMWLLEMYFRSPQFSNCVQCLIQAGAQCADGGLLAVLLDDAELLRDQLRKNPSLIRHRVHIRCAFTPLLGGSLLHVAAEFGLLNSAKTLIEAGADLEARPALDDYGFNGHTPIFHTVCQHRNHGQPVLRLLLAHGAKADVRLAGITWGTGFDWVTTILDPTPMSYAQAGLFPQFQRDERDVYENVILLAKALGRAIPEKLIVPNAYLHARRRNT